MDEDATWFAGRPQPRLHCVSVRWGPSSSLTAFPHFSVYVYWGQTAGWIKVPLGTEVGLGQARRSTLCEMGTQLSLRNGGWGIAG